MTFWKKFDKILTNVQTYICAILFTVIIIIGAANVFCRYVLNDSLTWAEEAMRFICIWLVFIGSSLTIRIDGHVSIDVLQSFLKEIKKEPVSENRFFDYRRRRSKKCRFKLSAFADIDWQHAFFNDVIAGKEARRQLKYAGMIGQRGFNDANITA